MFSCECEKPALWRAIIADMSDLMTTVGAFAGCASLLILLGQEVRVRRERKSPEIQVMRSGSLLADTGTRELLGFVDRITIRNAGTIDPVNVTVIVPGERDGIASIARLTHEEQQLTLKGVDEAGWVTIVYDDPNRKGKKVWTWLPIDASSQLAEDQLQYLSLPWHRRQLEHIRRRSFVGPGGLTSKSIGSSPRQLQRLAQTTKEKAERTQR